MPIVKKTAKKLARIVDRVTPVTRRELKFLESILEKRFLSFGLEPTNACNANCPFCAYRFSKKPKRIMPVGLYKKIIEEYNALGGGGINLTPTIGDPLMDKTIIEKIKIAKTYPNIKNIFFYTNLLNLHSFDIKELLLSGIDRISVSTAIGSRDMYKRIFGIDKYDQMLDNLMALLKMNREMKSPVKIILALRYDGDFDLDNNADYGSVLDFIPRKDITHLPNDRGYDNWGGLIEARDLPKDAQFRESKKERGEPCAELYRRINILADGNVNFCVCRDFDYEMIIGDANEESIADIWQGRKIRELRNAWRRGEIPPICRDCSNYEPLGQFLRKKRVSIWALKRRAKL